MIIDAKSNERTGEHKHQSSTYLYAAEADNPDATGVQFVHVNDEKIELSRNNKLENEDKYQNGNIVRNWRIWLILVPQKYQKNRTYSNSKKWSHGEWFSWAFGYDKVTDKTSQYLGRKYSNSAYFNAQMKPVQH